MPTTSDGTATSVYPAMHDALVEAQQHRGERRDFVPVPDGGVELGWVLYEREVMHAAVNDARAARGLLPVDVSEIELVESLARGHSDYTRKFAFGCAELSVGARRP